MKLCGESMSFQILTMILVHGCCMNVKVERGQFEGEIAFTTRPGMTYYVFLVIRWACTIGIYVGAIGVLVSIYLIEHPKGPEFTPPVSTALACIVLLTSVYLLVYFLLFVCVTVRGGSIPSRGAAPSILGKVVKALDVARGTVYFAPMVAVLFLAVRLRALQISGNRGAPQGWAQNCMW